MQGSFVDWDLHSERRPLGQPVVDRDAAALRLNGQLAERESKAAALAYLVPTVYCWGFREILSPNTYGATRAFDTSPVPIVFPGNVSAICAGTSANCAIMEGAVYCWGDNYYGQLGNGSNYASRTPVKVDFSAFF